VTHFFAHVKAGVIKLKKGTLAAGDTIYFKGHTTDFEQKVSTIQINHKPIDRAKKGQEVGLKIKSKIRHGDKVYKIT